MRTIILPILLLGVCAAGAPCAGAQPQYRRIITLSPALTEIVYALGAGERVAGVSQFTVYPPEALKQPQCGGLFNPNLEKIVSLQPDLILIQGRAESLEALCAERNVRLENFSIECIADIQRALQTIGGLLECSSRALTLSDRLSAELRAIRDELPPAANRPRVFIALSRRPGSLAGIMTAGGGTFIDEMIAHAGGVNIFADLKLYPQISKETLIERAPDVILEFKPGETPGEALRHSIRADWGQLPALPAVRNRRIEILTSEQLMMPTPRIIDSIRQIQQLLRPDSRNGE